MPGPIQVVDAIVEGILLCFLGGGLVLWLAFPIVNGWQAWRKRHVQ